MFKILLFLFITVPLVEIYLLIEIGQSIGALPTILLIIITAILGAFLLRMQGSYALRCILHNIKQGKSPAIELVSGLLLLITGVLLLTPGFFTDLIGFLCLFPRLRKYIANALITYWSSLRAPNHDGQGVVLEGECQEEKTTREG